MSKAFTREDAPDEGPVVRPVPRLAPGEIRYVTPEGQASLRQALDRLRAAGDPRASVVEATLAVLTVLGAEGVPEGRVGFGTWVTVQDAAGVRTTWRIVGPDEADPAHGRISVHSPVGRALLDREAGDQVEVERPGGPLELEVLAVSRLPP
jgi:transcription elongation factor GreB